MFQRYRRMWYSETGRVQLLKMASVWVFGGVIALFLLTTVVFAVFSVNLPDPSKVIRREGFSTVILDRNGKVLYDLYNKENRIPLELSEMPKYLQQATIAIEDKDFYHHQGFDILGMLRSVRNIVTLHGLSSGSTLTQQLVKNVLLSPEQTIFRKIKELSLANQIEKKFTKDQILQMYLNEAPYGGASYGVESASKTYFGKDAKDLTLIESAVLAGLPQSPTVYSPFGSHPKAYIDRTQAVLRRMREDGYITAQQESDADKLLPSVQFASVSGTIKAPHFVFFVKDLLVKRFGEQMVESGGLRVTTTLDLDLEQKAETIVNDEVKKIKPLKVSNGAAMVTDAKSGEILSMVGSYDFFDKDFGSYNVTTALRQPGSSGKPFIYATAFSKGYTPATFLFDAKTEYPAGDPTKPNATYTPENYDGKYRGPMQLRFALGNSINTIAVKLTALSGLRDIMTSGFNAGISTWEPTDENMKNVGLSLALGGREVKLLELTNAYGVFANGGLRNDPVAILKVADKSGKSIFEYRPISGKRVFSEDVSFLVSHILSDNNARKDVFGEINYLQIPGHTVVAKTGTTDRKRDNWTIGYDQNRVVGVWVGNNDNTVMAPGITSGVTGAAPIWNRIMREAIKEFPNQEFRKPDKVNAMTIDAFSGGLPHGSDATRAEYFIRGTEPTNSAIYKKLKIAKADGKLANDLQIKTGDYDEKEFVVVFENDPASEKGKNRWQEAINTWINDNKKDDAKWHPPTEVSSSNQNSVSVRIDTPSDHSRINDNIVPIKVKAYALRDIVKFMLSVDGTEKINKSADNIDESINLSTGKHNLKFEAVDAGGNSGAAEVNIGVNVPWDYSAPATSSGLLTPLAFL